MQKSISQSNFNMVSELVEFKGHLPIHAPSPKSVGRDGGVLGKTQVPNWIDKTLDKSLYRGGNPHLTSRFCKDELGPKFQQHTRWSKKVKTFKDNLGNGWSKMTVGPYKL